MTDAELDEAIRRLDDALRVVEREPKVAARTKAAVFLRLQALLDERQRRKQEGRWS